MSKKEKLTKLYYQALKAIEADEIIRQNIRLTSKNFYIHGVKYPLKSFNNLYIFAVGKAGYSMAKACEDVLGGQIKGGVVISHQKGQLKYLKHRTSTHPLVSKKSIESADLMITEMQKMKQEDRFIFLLSGGASAMIEKPIDGLSLEDVQKISSALLGSGIDIKALNSVRKSISQIKGGKLANFVKAKGDVLVLSDVIGDDLNTIGSSPMMNGAFEHYIIGNNGIALEAVKKQIEKRVEKTKIITTTLNKSSQEATEYIVKKIKKYDKKYESFCLLFGGETTTTVKGLGRGGRNQELALRLLLQEVMTQDISILCAGSDGIDGNSPATGAFLDFDIYKKMKEQALNPKEYLKNSDSYGFFKELEYDFTIGATGTNVMDFIIILKEK
ncbi:DUF4147 domain-containing protein [bacterium]|nr:DUF4147 domain-containing protein [bacterium]MBU1959172.1 DUF4147 domain-containing protein [bacterium]